MARWKKMPQLANYADLGAPKPGAVVLMNVAEAGHRPAPLLAIQNYGHGRTAILATAGTWRWKMLQDHTDTTDFTFWQQLLRWLVTETPGQVAASTPHQVLSDDTHGPAARSCTRQDISARGRARRCRRPSLSRMAVRPWSS